MPAHTRTHTCMYTAAQTWQRNSLSSNERLALIHYSVEQIVNTHPNTHTHIIQTKVQDIELFCSVLTDFKGI